MLRVDGGAGSGSGTVARHALVISALAGEGLYLYRIRERRPKPGLRLQHLAAVRAVRELCGGSLKGEEPDSRELYYLSLSSR